MGLPARVYFKTMDDKTQWLNGFVAEVIDGWMLNDLNRLINDIPHRSSEAGNCNFPIALYVFACVEFLGQLTPATPIDSKGSYTKDSIMGFIDDFFPDDFKQKIQPYRNDFVNIFRNGLAHNYFAKAAGISRTENEPLWVNPEGMLVLDADRFAEAFKVAIEKLKETIKTNTQLAERIVDRYDAQYQYNLRFMSPTLKQTFMARTSGASLPHPSMTRGLTTTSPSVPPIVYEVSKNTTTMPRPSKPNDES